MFEIERKDLKLVGVNGMTIKHYKLYFQNGYLTHFRSEKTSGYSKLSHETSVVVDVHYSTG